MTAESRYELLEQVGESRYATVYRARDLELRREVAVKQIREEFLTGSTQLSHYWEEARLLASLQHPNIVTIYDIDRDRGQLIMELMQATLARVATRRQMDLRSLKTTIAHCLRALKYLHSRGIIHGDIKPSNLMLDARKRIKIGDFGLARRVSDLDGTLLKGATRYIAPEIVSDDFGEVDYTSDLYSLGFSAYELMCGPPFEEICLGLGALRSQQAGEDPWIEWHAAPDRQLPKIEKVLEGVPPDLSRVIQKLTTKEKAHRYQHADEALSDLQIDVKIIRQGTDEDGTSDENAGSATAQRRPIMIGACIASLVLSLALFFLLPGGDTVRRAAPADELREVYLLEQLLEDGRKIRVRDLRSGQTRELALSDSLRVQLEHGLGEREHVELDDLKPGDRLDLVQSTETPPRVIKLIATHRTENTGVVTQVNVVDMTMAVAPQAGDRRENLLLRLAKGTRVRLNQGRQSVGLLDVQPEDTVTVIHVPDSDRSGKRVAVEVQIRRRATTVAQVIEVDATNRTLKVRYDKGDGPESPDPWPTIDEVKENVTISVLGSGASQASTGTLSDLKPNSLVILEREIELESVGVVVSPGPPLRGLLQKVQSGPGQITLKNKGRDVTVTVSQETRLFLNSRPCQLSDLQPGDNTRVVSAGGAKVARVVAAERRSLNRRWALLIGNQRYANRSLTPLPYVGYDVRLLKAHLIRFYRLPDDEVHVRSLLDMPRAELQRAITEFLEQVTDRTELFIYVAGHAYQEDTEDGRIFLATRGFEWEKEADTGLPLDWLTQAIDACKSSEKLLLLDCTHAGDGRDLEQQPDAATMLKSLAKPLQSTFAIGSCSPGQRGWTDSNRRHGLFAWQLAQGFRGPANTNGDGHIDNQELFEFVRDGLRRDTERLDVSLQLPCLVSPGR